MPYFRQLRTGFAPFWAVLLALVLLWTQGVRLHVHSFEHEHNRLSDGGLRGCELPHGSEVHLAVAVSDGHHTQAMSELDITPDGIPTQSDGPLTFWVVPASLVLFTSPVFISVLLQRLIGCRLPPGNFRALPPPLRAPPHA